MSSEAPKIGSVARQAENLGCARSLYERRCAVKRALASRRAFELALLGDALVRLARALDAVLLLIALGREHAHHLIDAMAITAAEQACDDVNIVANAELVSQGSLRITQNSVWAAATAVAKPVMGTMSL